MLEINFLFFSHSALNALKVLKVKLHKQTYLWIKKTFLLCEISKKEATVWSKEKFASSRKGPFWETEGNNFLPIFARNSIWSGSRFGPAPTSASAATDDSSFKNTRKRKTKKLNQMFSLEIFEPGWDEFRKSWKGKHKIWFINFFYKNGLSSASYSFIFVFSNKYCNS